MRIRDLRAVLSGIRPGTTLRVQVAPVKDGERVSDAILGMIKSGALEAFISEKREMFAGPFMLTTTKQFTDDCLEKLVGLANGFIFVSVCPLITKLVEEAISVPPGTRLRITFKREVVSACASKLLPFIDEGYLSASKGMVEELCLATRIRGPVSFDVIVMASFPEVRQIFLRQLQLVINSIERFGLVQE